MPVWLYVVHSRSAGLTKIGQTRSPSGRMKDYRLLHRDAELVARWKVGCRTRTLAIEADALARLPDQLRVRGDWFALRPDEAKRAASAAIGGRR